MRKKIQKTIAAVLLLSMTMGTTSFAATSPTTATATVVRESTSTYVVPRNSTGSIALVTSGGQQVRISADYSGVTGNMVATAVSPAAGRDSITDALNAYIASVAGSKQSFGPFKIRMYSSGTSIWSGFGTITETFGIGNAYDGRTVTIYQIHKDGSITTTTAVVQYGKISLAISEMGSFKIVLE